MGEMGKAEKNGAWRRRWNAAASAGALVAIGALNAAFGQVGQIGGFSEVGEVEQVEKIGEDDGVDLIDEVGEIGRIDAAATVEKEKGNEGNGGNEGTRAALERAFGETLARCESPILTERDAAEDALAERFAEFEPIWQDRRFLTNGEIGAEGRARFELAEARFRRRAFDECVAAFRAAFELDAAAIPETREEKIGEVDEVGEIGETDEVGETRGRIRLRWGTPLRIVYLTPDWDSFERRDGEGGRWRPSGRFSTPELAPEFDASELTVETVWERVAPERNGENGGNGEAEPIGEIRGNAAIGENGGKTTVVGAFEGLIGGDFRVWSLPLGKTAAKFGENEENSENKTARGETVEEDERENRVDFPTVFQSGDATATVGETLRKENGETTARVRFEFAEAFDAFDSHRVWFEKSDFALTIDQNDGEEKSGGKDKENGEDEVKEENKVKEKGAERAGERRREPIRLRARERSARGVLIELDFPNKPSIQKAVEEGRARLECRVPRFFFWARIPVAGEEKRSEER